MVINLRIDDPQSSADESSDIDDDIPCVTFILFSNNPVKWISPTMGSRILPARSPVPQSGKESTVTRVIQPICKRRRKKATTFAKKFNLPTSGNDNCRLFLQRRETTKDC